MEKENIVEKLTTCIENKTPVCYSKYGDGEYICANYDTMPDAGNVNCDNDQYTVKKQKGIIESFKYVVNNLDNSYIGAWETENVTNYWKTLVEDESKIKWANYHTFIIGDEDFGTDQIEKKVALYKAIQDSDLKKVMICNPFLVKAKELFKVDSMVHVPLNNWFDEHYDAVIKRIQFELKDVEQPIILTACGMGAKILIADLAKIYPTGIFLDIGSATDYICTTCDTRGRKYNYEDLCRIFKDILPENWNDSTYHHLHETAKSYLRNM
jgi:hypothetical protein